MIVNNYAFASKSCRTGILLVLVKDDEGYLRAEAADYRRRGYHARVYQRNIRAGGLRIRLWVCIVYHPPGKQ